MTRTEQALALFGPGYSCSQAILASLGPGLGMGLAQGLTCGAASAAVMVLGLAQGPRQDPERGPRYTCYDALTDFCQRFQDVHGSIACRDLIGVDLGTPEGQREAQERGLFQSRCPQFVKSAGLILEEML